MTPRLITDDIVDWLLAGDVAIQYQVRRDLLDEERPDLRPMLRLFMPDVFWLIVISGGFALVWSLIRWAEGRRAPVSPESEPAA